MTKPMTPQEMGRKGGKARFERHGSPATFESRSKGGKIGGVKSGEVRRAKRAAREAAIAAAESQPDPACLVETLK